MGHKMLSLLMDLYMSSPTSSLVMLSRKET